MTGRLILDVTSLLRWTGPPVGIARVEHALATAAMHRPDAVLACYDPEANQYRALNPAWQEVLLGWNGALDLHFRQPPGPGPLGKLRAMVPGRHGIVAALERVRLTTPRPALARTADLMQRGVLALRRHQYVLHDARGTRLANVPISLALAGDALPGRGDTVLNAGSGWMESSVAARAALQRGPRLPGGHAVLRHDPGHPPRGLPAQDCPPVPRILARRPAHHDQGGGERRLHRARPAGVLPGGGLAGPVHRAVPVGL